MEKETNWVLAENMVLGTWPAAAVLQSEGGTERKNLEEKVHIGE